ncbi:MAG: ATP-binding protein [Nocardioidaceae bacterium]
MRLLERETHLASLADYADEARAGHGRLVLVAGEAGVGKSALVEQLERELPDARWLWGACDGLSTPRPLGPLLDLAAEAGGELAELCRAGAAREELFASLLRTVDQAGTLTVLVVEDVHWADDATLDLLRLLGRRIRDAAVLLLVTYRDDGLSADHPLRVALGELATKRTTRRLAVSPLSAAAVELLADGTGLEPAALHRLTGGNPFFLHEVLHGTAGELPVSARDAVLARLAGLGAEARGALEVAALIGIRVDPALLAEVTRAGHPVVDELLVCGVLVADGDRLRFRHELARMAVAQEVAPHRRTAGHRDILRAQLDRGCDDDAVLAFHAEGAADVARVLYHAPRAAARASRLGAHREATAQYERALRSASGSDARSVAELYDGLAYELSLTDRWQQSADARQAALTRWREVGDRLREGDDLRLLSRTMWRLCRGPESQEAAARALEVLEALGPSTELAWAYANLATTRMLNGGDDDATRLARRAQELAERLDLADVMSDALNTEGCVVANQGRPWIGLLDRALQIATRAGLQEQAGRAYANIYAALCADLRVTEAEHYFVDGLAYCDEHDIDTFGTCLRGERTSTLEKIGRWDEAARLCVRLLHRTGPSPVNRLNPLISLGRVRARRGEGDAWACLDEAAHAADDLGEASWTVLARAARAEARWLVGDEEAAAHEIALAAAAADRADPIERAMVAVWRRRITGCPDSHDGPAPEPFASILAGSHAEAARRWDDLGFPYEAALALVDSTDETLLREAVARFERLGAVAAARRARQRMRDLGIRSVPTGARETTRAHPAGLTRREREVLELICAGHTNDEISGRLFISVKTVDHHVSAVLGKLGVPTRRVAASEARRLGLVAARK